MLERLIPEFRPVFTSDDYLVRRQLKSLSGKITELAVRDVVHGRSVRNSDALANPEALDLFRNRPELNED